LQFPVTGVCGGANNRYNSDRRQATYRFCAAFLHAHSGSPFCAFYPEKRKRPSRGWWLRDGLRCYGQPFGALRRELRATIKLVVSTTGVPGEGTT